MLFKIFVFLLFHKFVFNRSSKFLIIRRMDGGGDDSLLLDNDCVNSKETKNNLLACISNNIRTKYTTTEYNYYKMYDMKK